MVLAALLGLAGAMYGTYRFARSRTMQAFGKLVARVQADERVIALTFDDGPTAEVIDEIVSVLESRQVPATFFVNGSHLEQVPDLGRRLVSAGHELGNHTYSHERMVFRSQDFFRSEVQRTDELIRTAGQVGEIYFRPPFSWKLVGLPWYLHRTGRTTITWDIDADRPPIGSDAMRIVSECVRTVRPGSIILMHVWYPSRGPSRAAVPIIIDRLKAGGYRFVTVGELLKMTCA
jgi:peptidoglycan/xylan/chitin deacetylase (PgdA/CDA1 family)